MSSKSTKLAALRSKVNKSYQSHVSGAGTHREWVRISTGSLALDYAYGINSDGTGGPAVGVVHGLVAWESNGKTTVALKMIAAWQRHCARCYRPAKNVHEAQVLNDDGTPFLDADGQEQWMLSGECDCYTQGIWKGPAEPNYKGKVSEKKEQKEAFAKLLEDLKGNSFEGMVCVYVDQENALDLMWAKKQGVFLRSMEHIVPGYAEQTIDIVDEYLRSAAVDLLVVDSIAAMVPMTEIEESSEDWQRGLQARLINKAVRKWVGSSAMVATQYEEPRLVTQVWIQQWRNTMSSFGGSKVMPGGNGQRFALATLMEFYISDRDVEKVKQFDALAEKDKAEVTYSARINVQGKKNKTAPVRKTSFRMAFIDDEEMKAGDVLELEYVFKMAMSLGVIERSGSKYKFRGKQFTSQSAIQNLMARNDMVMAWTKREILKVLYAEHGP